MFFRVRREVEVLFDNLSFLRSRVNRMYERLDKGLTVTVPVDDHCSQSESKGTKDVDLKEVVQALIDHLGVDVTVQTGTRIQVRDKLIVKEAQKDGRPE